jgi:AraC family transcriptional regulator
MGCAGSRTLELPLCTVTEARFPPRALLDMHTHNRAVFGVMLRGSFETRMGARCLPCEQSSSWVEPREEKHANAVGAAGAWVIVVQPNPERAQDYEAVGEFLDSVFLERVPELIPHARRVAAEIAKPDGLTPLSIEAAALAMLTAAARSTLVRERARKAPPWLRRAREIVHETLGSAPGLSEIARSVDVAPTQLAHSFRQFYGMTVGAYARELRFAWALERIVTTDEALSRIAVLAGYADQSHMTRESRTRTGFTPRELRVRAR